MTKCRKCGYERQPKDDEIVPSTRCPRCKILYDRYETILTQKRVKREAIRKYLANRSKNFKTSIYMSLTLDPFPRDLIGFKQHFLDTINVVEDQIRTGWYDPAKWGAGEGTESNYIELGTEALDECRKAIGMFKHQISFIDHLQRMCDYFNEKGLKADFDEIVSYLKADMQIPQISKKDKELALQYVLKYISNKEETMKSVISGWCNQDLGYYSSVSPFSLEEARTGLATISEDVEVRLKSASSSDQIDEVMTQTEACSLSKAFLDDLEKFFRMFNKKNIDLNYLQILWLFKEAMKSSSAAEAKEAVQTMYEHLAERLGDDITTKSVIKQFIRDYRQQGEDPSSLRASFFEELLDKFNLDYGKGEIDEAVEAMIEEVELEEFESSLGQTGGHDMLDFDALDGRQFEEYLSNLFQQLGYVVASTPSSGDQGADLVIAKNDRRSVVQAKRCRGSITNKAVQEVVAAKKYYKAEKAIVITNSRFTKGAIDLALDNDVQLWDGVKLRSIAEKVKSRRTGL